MSRWQRRIDAFCPTDASVSSRLAPRRLDLLNLGTAPKGVGNA
jgi:hypothetical protein